MDIGSPYLAAEQLIDCHADVGVESGQHGKIRLSGAGRSFARAGTAVSEVAQRVDIDALGCQVGEEAMPRPGLKERVHLEALVADLELPALDLIAAIAVELDLAARMQGREFGNGRRIEPRLDGDLGRQPFQNRPQGGKAPADCDATAVAGAGQ
ncbi:MAG: hypothetical protein E5V80_35880 [Mesorhizobium sp.]|nr:MAG: hypothetical protein E5V80_35880 [Mesorhizobium sp.]